MVAEALANYKKSLIKVPETEEETYIDWPERVVDLVFEYGFMSWEEEIEVIQFERLQCWGENPRLVQVGVVWWRVLRGLCAPY